MNIKIFGRFNQFSRAKLSRKIQAGHGYSIIVSSNSLKENNFMNNLSMECDNYGYMSQELGENLDQLLMDDDYKLGIHRTGYTYVNEELIEDVFNKGLINNSDMMQGAITDSISIEKTVSFYDKITLFINQLKKASAYKRSQGCFIIRIPKSYLGEAAEEIQPIYYRYNGTIRLLPEFIYGYVSVSGDGKLGNIIYNPNYKDIHKLDNDNLLYDSSVSDDVKNFISGRPQFSVGDKYKMIAHAYRDTLIKYGSDQADQALLHLINNNDVQYFTGKENKELLRKHIIYGDVLDILSLGMDNIKDTSINETVYHFINGVNEEVSSNFRR